MLCSLQFAARSSTVLYAPSGHETPPALCELVDGQENEALVFD